MCATSIHPSTGFVLFGSLARTHACCSSFFVLPLVFSIGSGIFVVVSVSHPCCATLVPFHLFLPVFSSSFQAIYNAQYCAAFVIFLRNILLLFYHSLRTIRRWWTFRRTYSAARVHPLLGLLPSAPSWTHFESQFLPEDYNRPLLRSTDFVNTKQLKINPSRRFRTLDEGGVSFLCL